MLTTPRYALLACLGELIDRNLMMMMQLNVKPRINSIASNGGWSSGKISIGPQVMQTNALDTRKSSTEHFVTAQDISFIECRMSTQNRRWQRSVLLANQKLFKLNQNLSQKNLLLQMYNFHNASSKHERKDEQQTFVQQ
ncbi:hypothetical protein T4C_672 [Trichinella pseudospiralis]|uniref:Uncharacterized protein n=1 Tax=Trichinella pseudospiralis TaxID=6337 RepID=A0A0V1JPM9_TRIPS|nr:hypothetical protein T4C_672 [Trichinella pseudospiralis]